MDRLDVGFGQVDALLFGRRRQKFFLRSERKQHLVTMVREKRKEKFAARKAKEETQENGDGMRRSKRSAEIPPLSSGRRDTKHVKTRRTKMDFGTNRRDTLRSSRVETR